MNDTQLSHDALANTSREELTSALFASMVMQQTNLALMLLGKTPHPETGQTLRDLDGAKMFIDQLDMLQLKTRGNLDSQEEKLLKQSLTALRMAFVEAVEDHTEARPAPGAAAKEPAQTSQTAVPQDAAGQAPRTSVEDDSRKKFSKKY